MSLETAGRIEPAEEILAAGRRWLQPVREAIGHDFLAAYLTGSVLTQGFSTARSEVNVLVVARRLSPETLDAIARALPEPKQPHFAPLFMTEHQIQKSLDAFPIEWIEIAERHLLIEGQDVLGNLQVPRTYLRLQCERELRAKLLTLRHAYLFSLKHPERLEEVLRQHASGIATLFRTLLRLAGESPPADTGHVIQRVADLHQIDAEGLLGLYLVRAGERRFKGQEMSVLYRKFLIELERLVGAIDGMRVP